MNEDDVDGDVTFSISFTDVSGEVGETVTETTDDSTMTYCADGCSTGAVEDTYCWNLEARSNRLVHWVWARHLEAQSGVVKFLKPKRPVLAPVCLMTLTRLLPMVLSLRIWVTQPGWNLGRGADPEACGTPVAPHDGSQADSTYTLINDTLTINGRGSHVGLAKAVNAGELSAATPPAIPDYVSYSVTLLSADGLNMTLSIETGTGVFWQFKLVKVLASPIVGTWKLAPVAGALAVGPFSGSADWWSNSEAEATGAKSLFV